MENPVIKNGLYYAGAVVLITSLLWLVNKNLLFSFTISFLVGLALPIIFMIMANRDRRDKQEGYLSFGEGVVASMGTYAIGSFIGIIFTWMLINYIDPSLIATQEEMAIKTAEGIVEMFGGNEEVMEDMREDLEGQDLNPTLGKSLLGWIGNLLIPGLLFSLIVSAITKKGD